MRFAAHAAVGIAVALTLLPIAASRSHARDLDIARLKNAVVRQVYFEITWWGRAHYRTGTILPMMIASDGDRFVVRLDDLEHFPDGRRLIAFFSGVQSDEHTWILRSSGTPFRSPDGPPEQWWSIDSALKSPKIVLTDELHLPQRHDPETGDSTPAKERITAGITDAIRSYVADNIRAHRTDLHANEITVAIGDFAVEDPMAYVHVDEDDSFYEVEIFDPEDSSDPRGQQGGFPVRQMKQRALDRSYLRAQIKKSGTSRRVALPHPPAG